LKSPQLIRHAYQKHRLFRVLQNVYYAVWLVLKIDILAIGNEMYIAPARHGVAQPLAHFLLQEPQHAANFLE
jgi:hypothetical protein